MAKQWLEAVTAWLRAHGDEEGAKLELDQGAVFSLALELATGNDASNRRQELETKHWRVRRAQEWRGEKGLKKALVDELGWDWRGRGRGERVSPTNFLADYAWSIRRPEGRSCPPPLKPRQALKETGKKFGFKTYNAARQFLRDQIGKLERGEAPPEMVAFVAALSGGDDWRTWLKIPNEHEDPVVGRLDTARRGDTV